LIEREFNRIKEAYSVLERDPKWNEKTISLARTLFKFQVPDDHLN